jgi:acyl carrier protein
LISEENVNRNGEIREFIVNHFLFGDEVSLADDTPLLEEGIIDSTGFLELILFLEKTYLVSIESQELTPANLNTIKDIEQFLSRKLPRQDPYQASRSDTN